MIPTRRTFQLGMIPLAVVLFGQGAAWSAYVGWTALGLVLLVFLADGVLAGTRLRLRLERQAPGQLYVDQLQPIAWLLENRGLSAVTVQLCDRLPEHSRAEPRHLQTTVAAGSRASASYNLFPTQRGDASFGDLTFRVLGPLGLAWRQKTLTAGQPVRVLPHLANWKAAELTVRKALLRQAGSHRYRWRGAGTQFESLREYSPEDDIRWIDWKATARAQKPISRNFEVERHQQVILLVDASRMMTTYCGTRTKFDVVLEAAVLMSRAVVDQGDSLGLVLFSDQVEVYLHPRRERTRISAVMDVLYARQPRLVEPNYELALTLAARRNPRRSLIILFTDLMVIEAARRMAAYVRSLAVRHLPFVVTIADETLGHWEFVEPNTSEELYRVGVAHELVAQRLELLEQLRRGGAEVLDSPAEQLAARTIERYFDLKRRLRL
jgi:uncharacterized protein (DUF58 family)